jgi:pimeloyl-ACP methyl ester carboxylesterase
MSKEQVDEVPGFAGPGSEAELIEGVGHFMLVERPREINERILGWLQRTS